jgi:hypothetical protein
MTKATLDQRPTFLFGGSLKSLKVQRSERAEFFEEYYYKELAALAQLRPDIQLHGRASGLWMSNDQATDILNEFYLRLSKRKEVPKSVDTVEFFAKIYEETVREYTEAELVINGSENYDEDFIRGLLTGSGFNPRGYEVEILYVNSGAITLRICGHDSTTRPSRLISSLQEWGLLDEFGGLDVQLIKDRKIPGNVIDAGDLAAAYERIGVTARINERDGEEIRIPSTRYYYLNSCEVSVSASTTIPHKITLGFFIDQKIEGREIHTTIPHDFIQHLFKVNPSLKGKINYYLRHKSNKTQKVDIEVPHDVMNDFLGALDEMYEWGIIAKSRVSGAMKFRKMLRTPGHAQDIEEDARDGIIERIEGAVARLRPVAVNGRSHRDR